MHACLIECTICIHIHHAYLHECSWYMNAPSACTCITHSCDSYQCSIYIHAYLHLHIRISASMHLHTRISTSTYSHIYINASTYTHICIYIHAYLHQCIYMHAYLHECTICIHIYHAYLQKCSMHIRQPSTSHVHQHPMYKHPPSTYHVHTMHRHTTSACMYTPCTDTQDLHAHARSRQYDTRKLAG